MNSGQHRRHVAGQVRQQAGELGERVRRGQIVRGRLVPIAGDQDEAAALAGELRLHPVGHRPPVEVGCRRDLIPSRVVLVRRITTIR